jgi:hypothetical protein
MSPGTRDRTARTRIREFLAEHGPIEDSSGRATSILRDSVGYKGSSVAFIQLITAMDKANEIVRDLRGKRTYKIAVPAIEASLASHTTLGAEHFPVTGVRRLSSDLPVGVDYDELARALLREGWKGFRAGGGAENESALLDSARRENALLAAECDEYAKRLQTALQQLVSLVSDSSIGTGLDASADVFPSASAVGGETAPNGTAKDLLARLLDQPAASAEEPGKLSPLKLESASGRR